MGECPQPQTLLFITLSFTSTPPLLPDPTDTNYYTTFCKAKAEVVLRAGTVSITQPLLSIMTNGRGSWAVTAVTASHPSSSPSQPPALQYLQCFPSLYVCHNFNSSSLVRPSYLQMLRGIAISMRQQYSSHYEMFFLLPLKWKICSQVLATNQEIFRLWQGRRRRQVKFNLCISFLSVLRCIPESNVEASNISPACYRLILSRGLKCIHFIFDTLIRDNFENFSNSTCNFSTTSVKIDLKPTFDFVVMLHSILNCSRIWCFSVLYLLLPLLTI